MPNVNDINRKYHIYGDIEKKRLCIDIIYRLLYYYQNYFFVTLLQIIVWVHRGGLENKINE